MFPRLPMGVLPLGAPLLPAALLTAALLTACGEPPEPLPTAPPAAVTPSAGPLSVAPSFPGMLPTGPAYPTVTTYPTYPTYPAGTLPTTTPATTKSPTPTPSHAARCSGPPTRAQIVALVKGQPGIPDKSLTVSEGPYCSGIWSFSTVEVTGENPDQLEPLMVVATGKDATLALVAAGSDVCIDRVQKESPAGIRVLACGF